MNILLKLTQRNVKCIPQNLCAYLALLQNPIYICIFACRTICRSFYICLQIVDRRRSISKAANASLHTLDSLFRHIGALYTTHKQAYILMLQAEYTDQGILLLILTQYECKQIVTQSSRRTKYLHSALCVRIKASPKTKLIVRNILTAPK